MDKATDKAEFKLPDVSRGAVETPKELERALPEAVKNLPPPPTPSELPFNYKSACQPTNYHA